MTLLRKPILLRSSKLAKRRRRALYFKVIGVFLLAVVLIGVSAYLLSQPKVLITEVRVSGNEVLTEETLREFVKEHLEGRYVFLFPRDSIFLAPLADIENALRDKFERIKHVTISRVWFQALTVEITERKPYALWCRKVEVVATSERARGSAPVISEATSTPKTVQALSEVLETCYFLDGEGFIFTESPNFSGGAYFKYYGDVAAEQPVGAQFLTPGRFGELRLFLDSVSDTKLVVVALRITEEGAELVLDGGGLVLFSLDQNLTHALDNLESALGAEVFKEKSMSDLEYLDLRFGDKVYYRFRE